MGIGAIYHTLNPRLFPDQLIWIMNHAEDSMLFVDLTFVPLAEQIVPKVPSLKTIVILTDRAHMPATTLENVVCYEEWLEAADGDFTWRDFDENTAAGMCYTSGTTGNPKGVVYSHRSNVLHALSSAQPNMLGLGVAETIMPVVPLFHANSWSIAFSAPLSGAGMVMPGAGMDGESVYEMLSIGEVSVTAAVPTVWMMLLDYLEKSGKDLPMLDRVIIGGAACPPAMTRAFKQNYDVDVRHAWGMTEMSPLGAICVLKPDYAHYDEEQQIALQNKQGLSPFTVEMKIVDDDDQEMDWDGKSFGRLMVRGPSISSKYYRSDEKILDSDGYFDTGDVAHIDPVGYMQITDRSKDVIKSGGEWISSVELENLAFSHADVAEAAVIGVPHPKWDERPLLIVVCKPGAQPTKEDILSHMAGKIASWWMPDDVAFVDEIPHTATGKILKMALREQYASYQLPTVSSSGQT
jgi:fatty-acyl-CoA synthase